MPCNPMEGTVVNNKQKRYRIRYRQTFEAVCYVAAPSREVAVKCVEKGINFDLFHKDTDEEGTTDKLWRRARAEGPLVTQVPSTGGDVLFSDEHGNILGRRQECRASNIPEHLIEDYSEAVRWKPVAYEYAERRKQRDELPSLNPLAISAFRRNGFRTIEELAAKSEAELLRLRFVGRKAVKELVAIMDTLGYEFGNDIDEKERVPGGDMDRYLKEEYLSVRTITCLAKADIKYVSDLTVQTEEELLSLRNFGHKSLREVKEYLAEMNLSLGMKLGENSEY